VKARRTPAIDSETRLRDGHHVSLRLWLRLFACTSLIEARIRQKLQTAFDMTLPRFDLMAQLERCPDGLKMSELSLRLMVTGGNITGITDTLEREGLVERVDDPSDRRAWRVKLTKEGIQLFRKIAAEHERWLIELFAEIPHRKQANLTELLARLKHAVAGRGVSESAT
jgi:DNA-binding MarR family transcriptional regulator